MHFLFQFLIISLFCFLGELLNYVLPFPIPASIYGMVLLLMALTARLIKPEYIQDCATFLIAVMPCFFILPCVSLITIWDSISGNLPAIFFIAAITTCIVMAVTGLSAQFIIQKKHPLDFFQNMDKNAAKNKGKETI